MPKLGPGVALAGLLTLLSLNCLAEPVRVSYSAPSGCPDQAEFIRRIETHTQRLELAEPSSLARVLDVRIARDSAGFRARLEFTDARRERIVRQIDGRECGEVTEALALAVALLVEAEPGTPPEQPPPDHELTPPSQPPYVSEEPVPVARGSLRPGPLARSPDPPVPRPAVWSLSVSGRASSQLAPDPVYGVAIGGSRFQPWDPYGNEAHGGWRIALDAHYLDSGPVTFEQTSVRFRLLGVRSSVCAALEPRSPVFLELCGALEAGYWRASAERSSRLVAPRSGSALWAAAGLPVSFGVSLQRLQLFASLGPWFPLTRQRFTFSQPDSVVHEVQPVSASLDLGLRLAF